LNTELRTRRIIRIVSSTSFPKIPVVQAVLLREDEVSGCEKPWHITTNFVA
jgi:hypothetical protein